MKSDHSRWKIEWGDAIRYMLSYLIETQVEQDQELLYLAQTPRGSLLVSVSISLLTSIFSPSRVLVALHAVSTTCRPRNTSPRASFMIGYKRQ